MRMNRDYDRGYVVYQDRLVDRPDDIDLTRDIVGEHFMEEDAQKQVAEFNATKKETEFEYYYE